MNAYKFDFSGYMVAEDLPAASKQAQLLGDECGRRGFQPGAPRVRACTNEELARVPGLTVLIDRATRPRYGPACSPTERTQVVQALAANLAGDLDIAEQAVRSIEEGLGYLPRRIGRGLANRMLDRATTPDT